MVPICLNSQLMLWQNIIILKNLACLLSGDEVSRNIMSYIASEKLNATSKKSLEDFASNLSGVQDYRQMQVMCDSC